MAARPTKEKIKLNAEIRKVIGKKVKQLRAKDLIPGNIYGRKIKSQAIQLSLKEFLSVFEKAGETGLIELKIGPEEARPVLIQNVTYGPICEVPLHADFYQVDLKELITANIPVEIIGESPAVQQKIGIMAQLMIEVEVEALPADLPDKFEVDVAGLDKVDALIKVADLKVPAGVKIITPANEVLVKIEPPVKEEVKPTPAAEATPAEGEVKPGEEKPIEGEAKPGEKPAEPVKEEGKPAPKDNQGPKS